MNLQDYYDIRPIQSPLVPVNMEFHVYDSFGRLKEEMYAVITPKDPETFNRFHPEAVNRAVLRWVYESGYADKEKHEMVTARALPWAGLKLANFDAFLRNELQQLSLSLGIAIHCNDGFKTIRGPVPYETAKMARDLLQMREAHKNGLPFSERAQFIHTWGHMFDTHPRQSRAVGEAIQALAERHDKKFEILRDGEIVIYTLGSTVSDRYEIRADASGYKARKLDQANIAEEFAIHEGRGVIDWIEDQATTWTGPCTSERSGRYQKAPKSSDIHKLREQLDEQLPASYYRFVEGGHEFIVRRPKTLAGPEILGRLLTGIDSLDLKYLVWIAECDGRTIRRELRNMDFAVEFLANITEDMHQI
uniref:Uncharacterized protein n=1 Tax=Pseudomonas phage HRDY3 TaxID=3236930 RepID=A0AB39CDP2_9VIRU